ncbi:MAG: amidohydrolase [Cyclobacteriaceae bacterium]|jgi:amidohydrolase|nr:amidohydrolase [Cyclobacteriaceae bacterium]MDH4296689.1 amidohydrolase [Cyclobacteriaceae bacterium]MDH5248218.1 amidohydrolase [Cyclobacteriaceae bacterium]
MKEFLLLSIMFSSLLATGQNEALRKNISRGADKVEQQVIAWRRDIHEHPELSNREERTAALVARHLQSLGIEVKTGVAKTGVIGILRGGKPGPVVALRADMDALPVVERTQVPFASKVISIYNGQETGVMHACGHDSHVAVLMGVAKILAEMKKDLRGTVKFIFQPAEEGAPKGEEGGAELMVKEGALENPKVDVIFGLHINAQVEAGKITYRPGSMFASVNDMRITVKGVSSHGAEPWSSVDPIVVSAQIINSLQTILSRNVNVTQNAAVVTIGSIHGGNRSNIIPEEVEMLGTVRTLNDADESMVIDRIKKIVQKTAEAAGAKADVEIPYSSHDPVTVNDPALTSAMLPSLQRSAGIDNVILVPAETGAEDFSRFAEKVPGLYFYIGGLPVGKDPKTSAPHHTPEFFLDESGFKTGVIALTNLVVDYMDLNKHKQ